MLKIVKQAEPGFFPKWKKNEAQFNLPLREYILEKEQDHLCCYCEKRVTAANKDSHIEHVKPRDKYPNEEHVYDNLTVSCQTPRRCGNGKGNRFDDDFIVPADPRTPPEKYLTDSPNGEIRTIDGNQRGETTIEILNLNAPALVKSRRVLFLELHAMSGSLPDFADYFHEYPTFVEYFKQNFL